MNQEKNDIDVGWFFKIATSDNKICVIVLILHQIGNEKLKDYTGVFEMIGDTFFGEHKQTKAIKFENIAQYESYSKYIDNFYDAYNTFSQVISIIKIHLNLLKLGDQNMEKERTSNKALFKSLVIIVITLKVVFVL